MKSADDIKRIELNNLNSDGKSLKITIEGKSKVFGGGDLQIKAILSLIEMIDFKFQEEDNPEIQEVTYIQFLDMIGLCIKSFWLDPRFKEMKNVEAVKEFIEYFLEENRYEFPEYKADDDIIVIGKN
jgi:hypothetical protein